MSEDNYWLRRANARISRRRLFMSGGALTAGLALAACARRAPAGVRPSASGAGGSPALALAPGQTYDCTAGKEPWRSAGPPKRGGTLVMATLDWQHLDPSLPSSGNAQAAPQVYNSLLQLRGCFPNDTVQVAGLAKSWEATPDGLTWTLHVQNGVKWHNKPPVNGRLFTSADVAWNIDLEQAGGAAKVNWQGVDKHEEPDAATVVIHLKEPDAEFTDKLGNAGNVMLPREVKEQYGGFKTVVVGTGAFQVKSFKTNQEVILERNPDYYVMGDDGKPLPYLDGVQLEHFGDPSAEVTGLRTGTVDMPNYQGVRKQDADLLLKAKPSLFRFPVLAGGTEGLFFDPRKKPWDDPRVRQAVSLAINRDDLINASGGALAYSGFIHPGVTQYAWPAAMLQQKFKANLARARQLLSGAGYKPGDIKAQLTTAQLYVQDAQIVQKALQAVGIDATIAIGNQTATVLLQKGDFDLGWFVAGSLLTAGICANLVRPSSPTNYSRCNDPQVEQLAQAQAAELDPTKRHALLDQLQDRLMEVMPYVPGTVQIYNYVRSARVKNGPFVTLAYNPLTPVYVWLDPSTNG